MATNRPKIERARRRDAAVTEAAAITERDKEVAIALWRETAPPNDRDLLDAGNADAAPE